MLLQWLGLYYSPDSEWEQILPLQVWAWEEWVIQTKRAFSSFCLVCLCLLYDTHLGVFSTYCTFARKEKASLKLLDWKWNTGLPQAMFFFVGKHYHDNCFYKKKLLLWKKKKKKKRKRQNESQTTKHPLFAWTYHEVLLVIIEANCTTA